MKVKNFTTSNNVIRHFIFSQAGTLEKAIMELVMNEIDAKATRIDISIANGNQLIISGNGVGFQSESDVDELFGIFGFKHDTEKEINRKRTYGEFGLGRAQIFAFGRCRWLTNQFEMVVDLSSQCGSEGGDEKISFLYQEHKKSQFDGCKITVDLIEPMIDWQRNSLINQLRTNMKYAPATIFFDKIQLNTPYNSISWAVDTDHLLFQPSAGKNNVLHIYNEGMLVTSTCRYGVGGIITSRDRTFQLNVARNEIITTTCQLHAEMKTLLQPYVERQSRKKTKLSEEEQQDIIRQFLAGNVSPESFMAAKLFPAAKGHDRSLNGIIDEFGGKICLVISPDDVQSAGRELIQRTLGLMVSLACHFTAFNMTCPVSNHPLGFHKQKWFQAKFKTDELANLTSQLRMLLKQGVAAYAKTIAVCNISYWHSQIEKLQFFDPLAELHAAKELAKFNVMDKKKYTSQQKVAVKVLEVLQAKISSICTPYLLDNEQLQERTYMSRASLLSEETSGTATAWTDCQTYIAYNQVFLLDCMNKGVDGLMQLSLIILHELMHVSHEKQLPEEQAHSFDFFQNYERCSHLLFRSGLYQICQMCARKYLRERERAGLSNTQALQKGYFEHAASVSELEQAESTDLLMAG